jgi:hypothetical protein
MNNQEPKFNTGTHYRIELQGRVDVEWLQGFDSSVKVNLVETCQPCVTLLDIQTDQAGIVGLVRRLHGLGLTILKLQIVSDGGKRTAS